jgi:Flp pilus assembly pilin Flp
MIREKLQQFWQEEDGIGTLEILLIIAVIVIIAIAFRKWIIH